MTHRADDRIHRLADGSIDYKRYDARARRIRSEEITSLFGRMLPWIDWRKR